MADIFDEISALANEGALADMTPEQERAEIRRLAEQRRALRPANMCARHGIINCKRC